MDGCVGNEVAWLHGGGPFARATRNRVSHRAQRKKLRNSSQKSRTGERNPELLSLSCRFAVRPVFKARSKEVKQQIASNL